MEQLLARFDAEMRMLGKAPLTREAYLRHTRKFGEYFGRCPTEIGLDEVRQYLRHLTEERGLHPNTRNQGSAALRAFFVELLGKRERRP